MAPVGVVRDFGAAHGRTAVLSLAPPSTRLAPGHYGVLQVAGTVHHWVAADIVEYDVLLEGSTSGPPTFNPSNVLATVTVSVGTSSQATFENLSQGVYYRAFVTARGDYMGDPAGTLVTLNTTAATADFDFTATQDVPAVYDVTTTVVFDSVAFSGTGNLTFGSPADGGYGAAGPQFIMATTLPPAGTVLGTFTVGDPEGVAVDPTSHDVWVANYTSNNVTELSSTGSVLGTSTVGSYPRGVAVDATSHDVWVTNSWHRHRDGAVLDGQRARHLHRGGYGSRMRGGGSHQP